jgi:sugar phosphate isomerase/epimerase
MRPGIFARTFPRASLEETLDAVVAAGLESIQFNLSLAGGPSLPDRIDPGLAGRVRSAFEDRGLEMAAVSGTYNMAHPDAAVRARGRRALAELVDGAPRLGTAVITLSTGSRDPHDTWRWHPDNPSSEAWRDMLGSVEAALPSAERQQVTLAFEPEPNNVVDSAAAGRRLLEELRSPALKVVLDAANLVLGAGIRRQRSTLTGAFELIGDQVVLAHAKDVDIEGRVVAAGRGVLDYDLFIALLGQAGYDGPLVLHGLGEEEVPAALSFLRAKLAAT